MVHPVSHRIPRAPWYSGTGPRKPHPFRLQDCHLLWWVVPDPSTRNAVANFPRGRQSPPDRPHNPDTTTLAGLHRIGLGSSHFARRYFGNHGCFLFLGVLRCFTSPRSPRTPMYSVHDDRALPRPGCPIRTSPDHSLFSGSPKLFAASHVLRRLSTPRHPPIALSSLTISPLSWGTPKDISHTSLVKEHRGTCPRTISWFFRFYSTLTAHSLKLHGGGERIRTDDPLRAKQALFHLSYTPDCRGGPSWNRTNDLTLIRRAL